MEGILKQGIIYHWSCLQALSLRSLCFDWENGASSLACCVALGWDALHYNIPPLGLPLLYINSFSPDNRRSGSQVMLNTLDQEKCKNITRKKMTLVINSKAKDSDSLDSCERSWNCNLLLKLFLNIKNGNTVSIVFNPIINLLKFSRFLKIF